VLAMRFATFSQFTFSSDYWTNDQLVDEADADPYKDADGKFDAFLSAPATEIRGCLPGGCKTYNFASMGLPTTTTLKDLFATTPIGSSTNIRFGESTADIRLWAEYAGRNGWAEETVWMGSGINYADDMSIYQARVRFGALFNNYDRVGDADDAIGFGATEAEGQGMVGAGATTWPRNSYPVQGTIWVKTPVPSPTSSPTLAPTPAPTLALMLLYTEHTGQTCDGNGVAGNLGSIRVDVSGGDIGPCADECNSNQECVGFVHVSTGEWSPACFLRLGAMGSPTPFYSDTRTCYERKPTADPTPSPTPTPIAVSAVGDPHISNLLGQRFDLAAARQHVLVPFPSFAINKTVLRMTANVHKICGACSNFFLYLRLGHDRQMSRGKHSSSSGKAFAGKLRMGKKAWAKYGKVPVTVAQGRTTNGVRYFNVFTKDLANKGYLVGGPWGIGDHTAARLPDPERKNTVTL